MSSKMPVWHLSSFERDATCRLTTAVSLNAPYDAPYVLAHLLFPRKLKAHSHHLAIISRFQFGLSGGQYGRRVDAVP